MSKYILAIDVGTSGTKLLLLPVEDGKTVSLTKSYEPISPAPGWANQNPEDWWQAVCEGVPELLKAAGIDAESVAAIGVDGISWAPVALDGQGKVLADAPLWYDTRAVEECEEIKQLVGEERVFELSGNPVQPYYTYPKLRWMQKHDASIKKELRHVLTSNGYVIYRLTGELSQDESQAYGWPFYDMGGGRYDENMAETLGFDLNWLEKPCLCTHVAGTVTKEAAEACGLRVSTPVVAGGLDAACGALGVGVYNPGPAHELSGSAGGMSICTDSYRPVRGMIMGRHVVPNRWLVQGGTVSGGACMKWITGVLNASSPDGLTVAQAGDMAGNIAPGSDGLLFLPYMAGERSPIWNPAAKGVFFGLDYTKTSAHIVRAVMEGATMALRHNLDAARQTGVTTDALRAAGGASKSAVWMQMKADMTGLPIQAVINGEATAMGCAALAGVGTGIFSGFDKACERFVKLDMPFMPNEANRDCYDRVFEQYLTLYERLKPMMKG